MEFWFHCNNCTRRPDNWTLIPTYRLTNCGHILCSECTDDIDTVKVCKFCQRTGITALAIDKTLPPHVQKFFMPPKMLIESAEKRIKETIAFQHSQKVLMERCLVRKVVQLWYQFQAAKQDAKSKNELEREIACLKNALKCLKGELLRTLNNHREFEKQALQWGFKALSVKESGQNFSREQQEQQEVQIVETRILTESIFTNMFTNSASILTDGSSLSSHISDEPLDLSMKDKVDSVNEEMILSCSSSNSDLAKCVTAPFNSPTAIVLSKKNCAVGVQRSCVRKNTTSLSKPRASGSGSVRSRNCRLENSDHKSHPKSEYKNWVATPSYPILILRRVRVDAANGEA
ncbi:unnamed protein product [Cercopithifilaria johnstoni]|uniref:RING-type domain-containing protein n=1 Tax=Cercopithifilaria johnstoni TaxID=2874296 RepID=A0A8J2PX94_9BILA|nr:unnamed protein product [Cercopithifilaria johnstoni]